MLKKSNPQIYPQKTRKILRNELNKKNLIYRHHNSEEMWITNK